MEDFTVKGRVLDAGTIPESNIVALVMQISGQKVAVVLGDRPDRVVITLALFDILYDTFSLCECLSPEVCIGQCDCEVVCSLHHIFI